MARFNSLPSGALQRLSQELSQALPRSPLGFSLGSAGIEEVQIAESADIWLLPLDQVRAGAALEAALVPIGQWHHQLKGKGHALGYATSSVVGAEPDQAHLAEIGEDWQLSTAFDRAIDAIDQQHPGEEVRVRLISAPAYQLWALYANGPGIDEVYVLRAPFPFAPDRGAPLGLPRLTSSQFLSQLADAPFEQGLDY